MRGQRRLDDGCRLGLGPGAGEGTGYFTLLGKGGRGDAGFATADEFPGQMPVGLRACGFSVVG